MAGMARKGSGTPLLAQVRHFVLDIQLSCIVGNDGSNIESDHQTFCQYIGVLFECVVLNDSRPFKPVIEEIYEALKR